MALNPQAVALAAAINKDMGENTVVVASKMAKPKPFTSGALGIDIALGGGWPGNQWVEIVGEESNGKTAVTLKTIAANQALDENFTTLWIAAEHYDLDQATALGVNNDQMVVIPTQDMTWAYETILRFAEQRAVDCVVIDSYPAMIAAEEEEKGMDDAVVALGARYTGKFFRKVGHAWRRDNGERPILGIFINQYREKIGAFSPRGTPKTTPGGNAKNYAFYARVEVRRDEYIEEPLPGKNMKIKVGQSIKVTTLKNKAAAPRQVTSVDFYFDEAPQNGFHRGEYDSVKDLITQALIYDVIVRKGAYFQVGEERWLGRDAMLAAIRENLDLQEKIDRDVRQVALHAGLAREVTEAEVDAAISAGTKKVARKKSVA